MSTIYIAETDDKDWVALYVDDKRVYEAHDIPWSTMLSVLYNRIVKPEHTTRAVYDSEVMAECGIDTFPETVQELKGLNLVVTFMESPIKGD